MWTAIAGAALGGLSGLMKGDGDQKQTTKSEPWDKQSPHLTYGFDQSREAYDNWMKTGPYQGDLYAGMDDRTKQGIQQGLNWSDGTGTQLQNQYSQAGLGMLQQGQQGLGGIAGQMANYQASGGVNSNLAAAGQYAQNPYLDGQIDAVSRDVNRNLTEQVLPGVNRAASASGNMNSSRAGMAEGIALRGAQDRIADVSASMRGDAYRQGMNLAEQGRQFDNQIGFSGLQQAGGLYNNIFQGGLQSGQAAQGQAQANANQYIDAGNMYQQDAQNKLNQDYTKYNLNQNHQFDGLDRYWNVVGSNNWGGTSETTKKGPGVGSNIMQGMIGGASMFQGFGSSGGGGTGGTP